MNQLFIQTPVDVIRGLQKSFKALIRIPNEYVVTPFTLEMEVVCPDGPLAYPVGGSLYLKHRKDVAPLTCYEYVRSFLVS